MVSKKFVDADLAKTKPVGSARGSAFGSGNSDRGHFGRDFSPHFGGLSSLGNDDRGVAMIEYAMLCAAVALTILAAILFLGGGVSRNWNNVDNAVNSSIEFET